MKNLKGVQGTGPALIFFLSPGISRQPAGLIEIWLQWYRGPVGQEVAGGAGCLISSWRTPGEDTTNSLPHKATESLQE